MYVIIYTALVIMNRYRTDHADRLFWNGFVADPVLDNSSATKPQYLRFQEKVSTYASAPQ